MQIRASPNPIEMNSAAKLNEFGNHMTSLQQKIDLISAKVKRPSTIGTPTPPPIEETGDVEKDFETVFHYNSDEPAVVEEANRSATTTDTETEEEEIQIQREPKSLPSLPPPPLPKSAPPMAPEIPVANPLPPTIKKQLQPPSIVNTLKPWQKQHEYRPMSTVLKEKQVDPLKSIQFSFKPIGTVASSEDLRVDKTDVVVPTAIYSSQSVQNLTEDTSAPLHGSLDNLFLSKSSDDLVMPDIDGIQGIRSHKYKKNRHVVLREKQERVEQHEDVDIYENLEQIKTEVDQLKKEAAHLDRRKAEMEVFIRPVVKKPLPLPRFGSETELDRSSKTLSFVFDPKANEFVLESERENNVPAFGVIERNSALLQQRSSSTSNIVPIQVASSSRKPKKDQVKSLESLDFPRAADEERKSRMNEKGNFFNFRFFRKEKDRPPIEPVRKSVFYSDSVDLIALKDQKFEAKLVHIEADDDDDEEDNDDNVSNSHHYEDVLSVHETFNRSMSTFGQQNQQNITGGARKLQFNNNKKLSAPQCNCCLVTISPFSVSLLRHLLFGNLF